ncbi:membrane protein [Cystoisospora suis]|uniref:Membrane protein n=1 Tax=Cystoisospora suis TaxID=483139 RepID=A0A2C6LC67_9APIC|nr:membrane protein [Cystoisospora suis]
MGCFSRVTVAALAAGLCAVARAAEPGSEPFVQGTLTLNGKTYRAVCNCSEGMTDVERKLAEVAPICNPSKVKIHQDHSSAIGLNAAEIRANWGQPADVTFARVKEHHFSCLDDRITEPTLCTPGGDLGEFTLALAVSGVPYDEATATTILSNYVATLPPNRLFYHCTDEAALASFDRSLGIEGLDLMQPDPSLQADIKTALAQPRNIGCSHFRNMVKNPSWYAPHLYLPLVAIRAFLNVAWDRNNPSQKKMYVDVLNGKSDPKAFVEVATTEDCEESGIAPLLAPKTRTSQALFSHLNAVNDRRRELANFFTQNGYSSLSAEEFRSRMDRYGFQWLETTGSALARGLPFYRMTYV